MPIEIKQLEIKGILNGNVKKESGFNSIINNDDLNKLKKEVISSCLEKIGKLLDNKNDR